MKTDKQRMQQIANALKGMTVNDAISILQSVKREIKWQSKVALGKDHFTKEREKITLQYKPRFGAGMLEALVKDYYKQEEGTVDEK